MRHGDLGGRRADTAPEWCPVDDPLTDSVPRSYRPVTSGRSPAAWVSVAGCWFRDAAVAGIALNAARGGKLQKKRHALATRDAHPPR
jgi:hypothetical protein